MKCFSSLCLLGFLVVALAGCGRSVQLTPAKGVVRIDGKPAGDVLVQVMPDITKNGQGPTSQGVTNASGEFVLQTVDAKAGAAVGESIAIFVDMVEDRPAQGEVGKPPRFPGTYTTAKGGIPVRVEPGKDLVFELNSR